MSLCEQKITLSKVKESFPKEILAALASVTAHHSGGVYLAGGTVRDMLLNRTPADLDLTVSCHAIQWARELTDRCGGTFVALGREEDAARVVWQGVSFDFSSFRDGASTIYEDLSKRDLTINSLAVCIDNIISNDLQEEQLLPIIDPCHGIDDLQNGIIRFNSSRSPLDDPLRLLRVFRFGAVLNFEVIPQTMTQVWCHCDLITKISPERVACELDRIMASERAYRGFVQMAEAKILFSVFPELLPGVGMEQPASHHLFVFEHLLQSLAEMEKIQADPGKYFPEHHKVVEFVLSQGKRKLYLKWAALFHDLGKPVTRRIREDKGGRITFYNHDIKGAELVADIGERLRWSRNHVQMASLLVRNHMRPFFLANDLRKGKLTLKGCLRLIKTVDEELPALFVLSMADALAGKGEGSPGKIGQEVAELFAHIYKLRQERVIPIRNTPPLITGKDLLEELNLQPGPLFREILELVEEARFEGKITSRNQALKMAAEFAGISSHLQLFTKKVKI
jgi:poly(A) polymerase